MIDAVAHFSSNQKCCVRKAWLARLGYLLPGVLVTVIKLEPDETDGDELNGASPELAAHFAVPSKRPAGALTMCSNDCWVMHHLKQASSCDPIQYRSAVTLVKLLLLRS